MSAKVAAVQAYIEKLSYNFTGVNYFDVRKHRPMGRILETGREITRQALPIKCVEAVFVGAYLTQGLKELERVPLSFRSRSARGAAKSCTAVRVIHGCITLLNHARSSRAIDRN